MTTFITRIGLILVSLGSPALAWAENGIHLLEPIGGTSVITPDGGPLGAFTQYFNLLYPWAVGTAAGICILMGLVGGIQMITSGGDANGVSAGKQRIMMSTGGLLLVLFSATIMNMLNPSFFK